MLTFKDDGEIELHDLQHSGHLTGMKDFSSGGIFTIRCMLNFNFNKLLPH